jgi:hypothetical protein
MWLWQEEELQWRNALWVVFFELQLTPAIIAGTFTKILFWCEIYPMVVVVGLL